MKRLILLIGWGLIVHSNSVFAGYGGSGLSSGDQGQSSYGGHQQQQWQQPPQTAPLSYQDRGWGSNVAPARPPPSSSRDGVDRFYSFDPNRVPVDDRKSGGRSYWDQRPSGSGSGYGSSYGSGSGYPAAGSGSGSYGSSYGSSGSGYGSSGYGSSGSGYGSSGYGSSASGYGSSGSASSWQTQNRPGSSGGSPHHHGWGNQPQPTRPPPPPPQHHGWGQPRPPPTPPPAHHGWEQRPAPPPPPPPQNPGWGSNTHHDRAPPPTSPPYHWGQSHSQGKPGGQYDQGPSGYPGQNKPKPGQDYISTRLDPFYYSANPWPEDYSNSVMRRAMGISSDYGSGRPPRSTGHSRPKPHGGGGGGDSSPKSQSQVPFPDSGTYHLRF